MSSDLEGPHLKQGDMLAGKFRVERVLGAEAWGWWSRPRTSTSRTAWRSSSCAPRASRTTTTIARFIARGPGSRQDQEPARGARGRRRHARERITVHGDGVSRGHRSGTVLEQSGVLPVDAAVSYVLQTCEALAAAHAARVIHRDIKPSNLFLTKGPDRAPVIKVLDFRDLQLLDANSLSGAITETQRAMGSPSYMAPEQMRSARRVDGRADIWSTGVVLYELLTGQLPFTADTIPELYALILDANSVPSPMRAGREDLPEELERIVVKCLAKDPDERFRDVAELAEALSPFGAELGTAIRRAHAADHRGRWIAGGDPSLDRLDRAVATSTSVAGGRQRLPEAQQLRSPTPARRSSRESTRPRFSQRPREPQWSC